MSAVRTDTATTPMEHFAALAAEGLEPNARRFLRFQGLPVGTPIEMQALDIASGRYSENRFAHARSVDEAIRLLLEADRFNAQGVYFIGNAIEPAVASRAESGKWHAMKKGESTTDSEITHRYDLPIDIDPVRPKKTSATDAQVRAALARAEDIRRRLLAVLPEAAVGTGMSGNGGALAVALDGIPESPAVLSVVKGILSALDLIYSTATISIDTSVCDAKRLVPAFGTVKRKGAPKIAAYPHRRSAFTCADSVERVGLGDLEMLLANLRLDLTDEQNAAVDKAMGKKAAAKATSSKTAQASTTKSDEVDPFKRANACAVADVASRLGLMDGDHVKCPGCDTVGDSSVAFVGNGLKCSHNRCSGKGVSGGFRTPVDLVMEVNGCSNIDAVRQLGEWFGFEVPRREASTSPKAEQPEEWEAPVPFTDHDLPPFPIDALPPVVAAFVRAEAEATQTPPDLAGMLALTAFASAVAKRVTVRVKDGYEEPVNLFAAIVLPPGERKSQVLRDVLAPLLAWEEAAAESAEAEIRHAVQRFKISEKRLERAEARAASASDRADRERAELEAQQAADEHAALKIPVAPRLVADDVTPEALVSLLAQHGGRMAQFSAEGSVFSMLAGRYSATPNLDAYLKGHAGDPIRVDRKGRAPEHIADPALTVGIAVQPAVLESFAEQPMFRGVGLLARFLYALPLSRLGVRNVEPKPVPFAVREAYGKALGAMLALDERRAMTVRLSPAALAAYHDFARWVEPQLAEFGPLSEVRDWAAKLPGAINRISGILALISLSESFLSSLEISLEDYERAVAIGKYLVPHAKAAFGAMGADSKLEGAKQVWRCIERNGWKSFTRSQLQQALKGAKRFEHAEALDEPLRVLEERHYLRRSEERTGKAGRPKTSFLVNPSRFNPINAGNGVSQ